MQDNLDILNEKIRSTCCSFKTPHRVLLGYGSHSSYIMFIGEAPAVRGIEEGICPFSRRSWPVFLKVLDRFNITPEQAYTTNLVKCSIPNILVGNARSCIKYLVEEVKLLDPKIIVVLSSSTSGILQESQSWLDEVATRKIIYFRHPMSAIYNNRVHQYIQELTHLLIEAKIIS